MRPVQPANLPPWPAVRGSGVGAGKGPSKTPATQRSPITADDNLNSTQYARLLLLLGEGEQEGFPSAAGLDTGSDAYENAILKDIYLNKTPILKASADVNNPQPTDFNFAGVAVAHSDGTAWQESLGGFDATESQKAVNLVVQNGVPITRSITDDAVDAVRITLRWDALQQIFEKGTKVANNILRQAYSGREKPIEGDIIGAEVQYEIQVAGAGGSFTTALRDKVSGRTGDAYSRSHEIPISGTFPIDIRVVRVTPDATSQKIQDTMIWQDYTELIYAKLRYPHSALLGLQIDARYFNSWPQVSVRKRAIKVPIPDNATVDSKNGRLVYAGIWTGSLTAAQWTTDPAWILFETITNCRWGFGQHCQPRHLDKWSFYKASKYCSELVSDGKGGLEPRFSCNVNIQNAEEGFDLINQLSSVFRAMPYWGEGLVTIVQDAPADPILDICNADISPDGFRYAGASARTKHTVFVVKYFNNTTQDYDYVTVKDADGIEKYGAIIANLDAFACTSRSQAHRLGEWMNYTEQRESEVVTFTTHLAAGAELRPGHIFNACDLLKTGVRRGGKIMAASLTSLTVDDTSQTDLPSGADATITAKLSDGSLETRSIGSIVGAVVTPTIPFTSTPILGGTWSINNNQMRMAQWRVLSVTEQNRAEYVITGIRHNASKYDYVERDAPLEETTYSPIVPQAPPAPGRVIAAVTKNTGTGLIDLNISWPSVPGAVEYELSIRKL